MHIGVVELLEGAVVQRLTDALHQVVVKIQVVHNGQAHAAEAPGQEGRRHAQLY